MCPDHFVPQLDSGCDLGDQYRLCVTRSENPRQAVYAEALGTPRSRGSVFTPRTIAPSASAPCETIDAARLEDFSKSPADALSKDAVVELRLKLRLDFSATGVEGSQWRVGFSQVIQFTLCPAYCAQR